MSKPDWCPENIWEIALAVVWEIGGSEVHDTEPIACALFHERNNAAKIADDEADRLFDLSNDAPNGKHKMALSAQRFTASRISQAIRNGGK